MLFVAKKKSGFLQDNLSVYTSDITSKCAKGKLSFSAKKGKQLFGKIFHLLLVYYNCIHTSKCAILQKGKRLTIRF